MSNFSKMPDLQIGDLRINPPIIQGGMGVRVSASGLASAVSNEGALGVVASVGTGEEWPDRSLNYATRSYVSLRDMLQETKAKTSNPIGVNIMSALTNYEDLVRAADEENVAAIISGGGLPLHLPGLVKNPSIKLIPIVSSARAADLICRTWYRKHKRLPDALIVEGVKAGGHLGFSREDVDGSHSSLENTVKEILELAARYAESHGVTMPVVPAGGVFDGKDIARFLNMGASGVQMGTRFVCTHECDASEEYKQAYLNCSEDDILIIQSPLKLPLRVIRNEFVERIEKGEKIKFHCIYRCLATCEPQKSPYCIAQALVNAYRGNMSEGFATCGANAHRINKIVSVHELIQELVDECLPLLNSREEQTGSPTSDEKMRQIR